MPTWWHAFPAVGSRNNGMPAKKRCSSRAFVGRLSRMSFAPLRIISRFSRMAALLGVCALLLRCVIAPGVMPDVAAAANGVFKLVICTGSGIKLLHGGAPDGSSHAGHPAGNAVCPYAASGSIATPADRLPLHAPAFGIPVQGSAQQPLAPAGWSQTPGARAPPSFA